MIVGGGAAGFFAAIACAEGNPEAQVTLYELTAQPLAKVRISGGGRCNATTAFTEPVAGEWGNAGRNTIPGPTTFSLDGSLGRVFRLGERRNIDLQVQAQNVLNRVTITSWGTVLGSSNYGLASGAAGMRKITVNLRFRF